MVEWNLVVTGVALLLTMAGFVVLGHSPRMPVLVVVGAGSFLVYTLDRRLPFSPEDESEKAGLDNVALAALLASPCLAAFACLQLTLGGRVVVAFLGLCSATYILPVLPGHKRLKDVPYLKTIFVLLGWGAATVLLPATQSGRLFSPSAGCLLAYRLAFLSPNLLLADWPDREADLRAGIRTVANQSGEKKLLGWCRALAVAAAWIALFGVWRGYLPWWILAELPALAVLLFATRSPLSSDRRFFLLVVDGLAGWPGIPAMIAYFGWPW